METEPSDRTIVLHLLRGAVPERADEISGLWSQYGHGVEVAPSTKGVTMKADVSKGKEALNQFLRIDPIPLVDEGEE